jgi:hypothetical protein
MLLIENKKKWQTCHVAITVIVSPVETSNGHETERRTTKEDCCVTVKGFKAYNDNDNNDNYCNNK